MSTRLHRKPGPSKYGSPKDPEVKSSSSSLFSRLEYFFSLFEPVSGTYQTPLTNYYNFFYLGELYVGSNEQKLMVNWDTGSSSLLLESSVCTSGCVGDVFQIGDSTSFAYKSPADYDTTVYLDGTTLYGQWGTDKACPVSGQANGCASAYPFVAIITN